MRSGLLALEVTSVGQYDAENGEGDATVDRADAQAQDPGDAQG